MIAPSAAAPTAPSPADEATGCLAAARARRTYLRELSTGQRPMTTAMRGALAAHVARLAVITSEVFGACEPAHYAWWLGLDSDPGRSPHLDDVGLEQYVQHAITALRDPHCALLAAIAADCEHLLDQPGAWRPSLLRPAPGGSHTGLGTGSWLALVAQLGYRWTSWESRQLAAACPELPGRSRAGSQ